jgi:hypothetical protein
VFNIASSAGGADSAKAQKSRLSFMGGLGLLPSSLDDYVRPPPHGFASFFPKNNFLYILFIKNIIGSLGFVLEKVASDFSFAQLHLTVPRSICSFGQATNLIIGTYVLPCVCAHSSARALCMVARVCACACLCSPPPPFAIL